MIEMLLQADRLLTVDLVDQADAIYRRVAEQDPRNAIAVVGMARCALARGEDADAYRLAAQALAIDPENDMARRMTARMAEVLVYRGDGIPDAAGSVSERASPVAPPPAGPVTASTPVAPAAVPPSREQPSVDQPPDPRSWLDRILGR